MSNEHAAPIAFIAAVITTLGLLILPANQSTATDISTYLQNPTANNPAQTINK